ncbi:MAG: MBOAT family protein, partial [Muribaculaceae bacterium]|nr:MBOAT family protein [Muribaculaceae bacterium]
YALQIYCDFSGYSDMAIGIALLMGFHFNINFNSPYKAVSITDFWRRWHISLSTWLRDYLYISLGGNRHGKVRQYLNLFITMFLGGLWHGAAWNFVIWGSMHGIALAVHKQWMSVTKGRRWVSMRWWHVISVLLTFHFVLFAWILFRDPSFSFSGFSTSKTVVILSNIFTNFHVELFAGVVEGYWKVLVLIVVGFMLHFVPDRVEQRCKMTFVKWPTWTYCLALILIVLFVVQIKSSDVQPFIYFQF